MPKKLNRAKYEQLAQNLRVDLVNAQYDLQRSNTSVVLLLAGNDLPGCEAFIDVLQEWVDVRFVDTRAFRWPSPEESRHPPMWRYWRALPRNGRMAIFYGAWIMNLVLERSAKTISRREFQKRLDRLNQLEKLLLDDGKIVLKIWLHVPEKRLRKRLLKATDTPSHNLYVSQFDQHIYQVYRQSRSTIKLLNKSLQAEVPWQWIDGSDARARNVTIAQRLLSAIQAHLSVSPEVSQPSFEVCADTGPVETGPADARITTDSSSAPIKLADDGNTAKSAAASTEAMVPLALVDLQKTYGYEKYKNRLRGAQVKLRYLFETCASLGVTPVLAFEGWDAAGKGGVIRRITRSVSAWSYRVVPVAAPTKEELDYHYLWRFWRQIPKAGQTVIFDRTWYGRVLVERVEGYASEQRWQEAYAEINDFEAQLTEANCCVIKFWLHIDPQEQLSRFHAREKTHYKKYKITDEDYRNREKWPAYEAAVNDMVVRTSTSQAPWHLVPANDKRYARVQVLETVCRRLEEFITQRRHRLTPLQTYKFHHL